MIQPQMSVVLRVRHSGPNKVLRGRQVEGR